MYGNDVSSGIVGGSLAATGLSVGSGILMVLGVVFVVVGVFCLLKKDSKNRP